MPTYAKSASIMEPNNNSSQSQSYSNEIKVSDSKRGSGQSSISSSNSDDMRQFNSNADYDHIRNTTLMFFLDRLFIASKDGKEARTLHDLSCLFGTKDFTKEMRQIVGASRNGLKKFLQSYPSLFTIEGDKVHLTQLKQDSNPPARDYNKEAVEYFTQKLLQFGASLVPIRNLFGYRSQASQEVRHVSGKNTKEFKQFLSAHEDAFEILNDEHVILKSSIVELESRGELSQSRLQQVSLNKEIVMDPYLNKQFAHSIEECMKAMKFSEEDKENPMKLEDRVTLEYLHEKIIKDCNNQLFLKMVTTIEDLKVFLRMHPKIFKRFKCDVDQREYVSLLTEEEREEMKLQAYPSLGQRQNSTLKRCETSESQVSDSQQPLSLQANYQNQKQPFSILAQQPTSLNEKKQIDDTDARSITSTGSSQNNGHSSLRATAPPFVPSTHLMNQPNSLQAPANQVKNPYSQPYSKLPATSPSIKTPIRRSVSNLSSTQNQQPQQLSNQRKGIIDPRHALRSYLIKASVENSSNGLFSTNKHSNGSQPLSFQGLNGADDYDLKARTVNIVREASNIITRIMNTADAVALDCNGYNLGFNGQITMIQFGFLPNTTSRNQHLLSENSSLLFDENRKLTDQNVKQKPEVCVFDLITNPELAYCLKPLLESEQIVKILHDVRNKSNLLYSQFGIMLNNVFDTQVANLVIQQQETGKPAYKSRHISMSRLVELYGGENLMKYRTLIKTKHSGGNQNSSNKTKDVNYWRVRPLTEAMVYESTMDVYCLVGGVYQNLKSKIKSEYEPLFKQLNLEGVLARIKPDEIRSVKKERKIDLEVIDLKRKLYSDSTSSIVLSNREIRLLRHIDLTEEVRNKIQQCKKVAKKLERLDMKAAQMLQSMNSQVSSDGDQSLDITNSIKTNESNSTIHHQSDGKQRCHENGEQRDAVGSEGISLFDNSDLGETGIGHLMDSSMFDELKDRMIESSSLLESLEDDDDDDDISGIQTGHRQSSNHLLEHNGSHDNCRCNCHRSSIDGDKTNISMKSSSSSYSTSSVSVDREDNNVESRAVDMAVQCDLLS